MRWGVEKRLEFIEFSLFWEGGINRADIMERFGVSVPQASKDLSLYEEKAPGNLRYDKRERRYLASPSFKPVFLDPDADRYLAQLRSVSDCIVTPEETWLAHMPDLDTMPIPHRRVDVGVLRSVLFTIRQKRAVEVLYQSMNPARRDPIWRWITPHALGNDGLRWHVRSYCHIDKKFKDFLLSRCLDTRSQGEAGAMGASDAHWNEIFEVVLSPNPLLSEQQQKVVAQDYNMAGGQVVVPVRKALLYYFEKRLRLDVADALDEPQEAPIIVANHEAFAAALAETMA